MDKCPECGSENISNYDDLVEKLLAKKFSRYFLFIIKSSLIAFIFIIIIFLILMQFMNPRTDIFEAILVFLYWTVWIVSISFFVVKNNKRIEKMKEKIFCKDCLASWDVLNKKDTNGKKPRRKPTYYE